VLTDLIDWRAIFYINLPVGILVAASVVRLLEADGARPQWRGLDTRGALVATASLASLLYALAGANTSGWTSARTLGFGAGALIGLAAFVVLEGRSVRPLLQIERLADRAVGGGFALMLMASAVLFGSFLLVSIYLQDVLGSSPLQTGVEFLPIAAAAGLGAHVGSKLIQRLGVRTPIAIAFGLGTAGALLLSGIGPHGSYFAHVLPGIVITGIGIGIAMVGVATAVLTGAGHDDAGMLSGLNNTGHEVGGALGLATLATIAAGSAGTTGLSNAFTVAAGIAGAGLVLAVLVLPEANRFLPLLRESPAPVSIH
jgi:predicted MFS family arabinose efflux permease